MTITSQIAYITSSSSFFCRFCVSLVTFSYWTRFHVNIITSFGVMTIYVFKRLTRIRKSKTPPSKFCPISGDLGKLEIPNLTRLILIKSYWMLQNARVTAFTVFEFLREKLLMGGGQIKYLFPLKLLINSSILSNLISKGFAPIKVLYEMS